MSVQLEDHTVDPSLHTHSAHNYHPLPIVIAEAEGTWVTDVHGRRYLDCLAGYSALNFGHRHPALIAAAHEQLDRVTLTSRAFHHDRFADFTRDVARLTGTDVVLPMNTGAEAVETAIKLARRWGYQAKGVAEDRATVIVMDGNFHGRTTTIVGFSTDEDARTGFGPFTPGSSACRSGTPPRSRRRSTRRPSRSCSSPSRARPASSSRPRATSATCAASPTSTAC
jgi:ornithine--oxo-acid transaminase